VRRGSPRAVDAPGGHPTASPSRGGRNQSPGVPPWPVWGGWTPPPVLRDAGPEVGDVWGKPPIL